MAASRVASRHPTLPCRRGQLPEPISSPLRPVQASRSQGLLARRIRAQWQMRWRSPAMDVRALQRARAKCVRVRPFLARRDDMHRSPCHLPASRRRKLRQCAPARKVVNGMSG
eukprot:scaffold244230_cov31-Tisochrysis_lutea.AAC.2